MSSRPSSRRRLAAVVIMVIAVGLIAFFETHHRFPAFRAWSFGATFLLIAAAAVVLTTVLRNTAVMLATVVFGLFVLEGAANLIGPKGNLSNMTITPRWIVARPVVGFGFDRAMVIHSRSTDPKTGEPIFEADYTIGPTFDRVVRSAPSGPATVFWGDSFTFGEGLNDPDTLPQRFADLEPKARVLNLAVTGYSPQQFLREVETGLRDDVIGPKPSAFIFLTSPFHAMRTACKETWTNRAPRYALVDDKVTYQGACHEGAALLFQDYLENTALFRVAVRPYAYRLKRADVDLYIRELAEAARISRKRYGVETLVPFIQTKPNYLAGTGWDNDSVIKALRDRGVWVVDMTLPEDPAKGFVLKADGHPTGIANEQRARMIETALMSGSHLQAAVTIDRPSFKTERSGDPEPGRANDRP